MKKLRDLKLRLTEAAEQVYELFEKTIEEYEEELRRRGEENQRQQRLLEAIYNPQLQLYTADILQLLNHEDPEIPQHSKEDQEDPETPRHSKEDQVASEPPPHSKEEEEDLRICQEAEQLPVTVKNEDDEEESHSSQMETGADGEDCEGPEPARISDPGPGPGVSSETDVSDDDWKETRKPQSGFNSPTNHELPVSDSTCVAREKPFHCSECGKRFGTKSCLKRHMRCHTGEKPYSCSICQKSFTQSGSLQTHMRCHTEEKPYSCLVCDQRFAWRRQIRTHQCAACQSSQLRQTEDIREAAPPASSSTNQMDVDGEDCGGPESTRTADTEETRDFYEPERGDGDDDHKETREPQSALIQNKVSVSDDGYNTRKKPFSCSECGKSFPSRTHLKVHMMIHTGEKPFSCTVCGRRFNQKANLIRHMVRHTGEKAFSCPVCKKRFKYRGDVGRHMKLHARHKQSTSCVTDSQTAGSQTEPQLSFNYLINDWEPPRGERPNTDEGGKSCDNKASLERLMMAPKEEKLFSCSVCGDGFSLWANLMYHMTRHSEGRASTSCVTPDEDSLETEVRGDDGMESSEPKSGLNSQKNYHVAAGDERCKSGGKSYTCSECGRICHNKTNMTIHMRVHTGEKPFTCSICAKGFTQKANLLRHMPRHTRGKAHSCLICKKWFRSEGHVERHMRVHNSDQGTTNLLSNIHLKPDPDGQTGPDISDPEHNLWVCSVCGKTFGNKTNLKVHTLIHTGEKPFSCTVCGRRFNQKANLIRHMVRHTGEKPFSCSVCKKRFKYRGDVGRHMKLHTRDKPSTSCVTDSQTAVSHGDSHCLKPGTGVSNYDTMSHLCSECGNRFSSKASLEEHMMIHTGEKPSSLDQEDPEPPPHIKEEEELPFTPLPMKSEYDEEELKADGENCGGPELDGYLYPDTENRSGGCFGTERDNGEDDQKETRQPLSGLNPPINEEGAVSDGRAEKPASCTFCGKSFTRKYSLKVHMRLHTGEKPFSCSVCGKGFVQRYHYLEHTRCHTGENTFDCSVCGKKFGHNFRLQGHMRIHTGERPFSCSICSKGFRYKGELTQHMRVHSGEKPFSCSICHKAFRLKCILNNHMKIHTRDNPSTSCVTDSQTAGSHRDSHCLKPGTGVSNYDTMSHLWSECGNRFSSTTSLEEHMMIHTGVKPSSLDQEDPEPPLHIKEEEELPFTPLPVKSEYDEEELKADGEDCGGPELDGYLYPDTENRSGGCFGTERDNGEDDQKETRQPPSGVNPPINEEGAVSDGRAEKPASCTFCGKSFTRKYSLKVHMRLHTGEKPFSCSVCGKGFVQRYHYLEHTRRHTGENTFDCSVCGKKFGHNFRLQGHMRSHTGEKPFSCFICHKAFHLKCILNKHMKIHSREQSSNLRHETHEGDIQLA